ncbi:nitrate- and nitrite sensing domain-containing protein, partial [Nocardiopsis coralliicola]
MRQPEEGRRGIRAQLRGIVLIPGATFLALFALLGAVAAGYAAALHLGARDAEEGAAVAEVLAALQTERRLAAEHLAAPGAERLSALRSAAETTDSAVSALDASGGRLRSADDPGTAEAAASFHSALAGLGTLRSGVIAGELPATEAADSYGSAADRGIALSAALSRTLHHAPAVAAGTDAAGVLRAQQGLAAADARLSGALAGSGPSDEDRRAAVAAADAAEQRLSEAGLTLPGGAAAGAAAQTAATP